MHAHMRKIMFLTAEGKPNVRPPSKFCFLRRKANQMFVPTYFYAKKWCFLWFFMKIIEKNDEKSRKIDFFCKNISFLMQKMIENNFFLSFYALKNYN